jgi:hypothetical protein
VALNPGYPAVSPLAATANRLTENHRSFGRSWLTSPKRYVRRDEKGLFKESDDVGRSSAQDQKRDSKTKPKRGEGDKGDR